MVNNTEGYNTYLKSKIMTASPAELTLMLYEGAIKFANKAVMAIQKNRIEDAHINIVKTEKIIEEFRATLDFKYPVYEYLLRRLMEANIKKDTEILEECLTHLRTMRETWKEVMNLNKPNAAAKA